MQRHIFAAVWTKSVYLSKFPWNYVCTLWYPSWVAVVIMCSDKCWYLQENHFFFHYDDNVISTWEILDLILLPHGKTVNLTGIQALSYMYLIVNSKKLCYACDCWRNWPMSGLKFQSLSVQCMVTNPFRICYGQEWQQSFMTRFLLKVANS